MPGVLVQFEANGLGESSLRLIEAAEAIRSQFECSSYVQQVCRVGAKFGGCLSRQFERPFKKTFLQPPELENTVAQVIFEIDY